MRTIYIIDDDSEDFETTHRRCSDRLDAKYHRYPTKIIMMPLTVEEHADICAYGAMADSIAAAYTGPVTGMTVL